MFQPALFLIEPVVQILVCLASPANKVINSALLCVLGVLIGGVSNIIGTTVTTDIGKQEAVGSNTDALSTVTGESLRRCFLTLWMRIHVNLRSIRLVLNHVEIREK